VLHVSGKAVGWVLRNGPARSGQKAVLTAIADAADIHGENAYISWASLIERSGRSRSRVAENLRELIADGWVEVAEAGGPGRGRVTTYRIPGAVEALGKGPVPEQKRSRNGTGKGPETEQLGQVVPLFSKTVVTTTVENNESPHSDDVSALCDHLANRVAELHNGARPNTDAWPKQMRLLIERGPLHRERPEPMSPIKIRNTIDFIFDHMADPEGRGAFCWADQIRSAHALRDHWDQMARAAENKLRARRSPTAAILDRMSPGAGSNPLPVHLLPQTTSQRRAIR
jgi:hypothetical protein